MVAETLITRRLILRRPKVGDLDAFTRYCQSDRAHFQGGPTTAEGAFDRFAMIVGHWVLRGHGRYVIERGGIAIGHTGLLTEVSGDNSFSWALWDKSVEGQGYAGEAAYAAARHLLIDCGWTALRILIQEANTASRALAERLGAQLTDRKAPDWYAGALTYSLTAERLT